MKYRMYSLVLRQLNPIQKGVQTTHAAIEYANTYFKTAEYQSWSNFDKTLIMLDGGTYQEMMKILETLETSRCKYQFFEEEDLNNMVTSLIFIADERVWDKATYPDFDPDYAEPYLEVDDKGNVIMLNPYDKWLEKIGGKQNEILREIISNKRLAN